jgi:hypothetical protein
MREGAAGKIRLTMERKIPRVHAFRRSHTCRSPMVLQRKALSVQAVTYPTSAQGRYVSILQCSCAERPRSVIVLRSFKVSERELAQIGYTRKTLEGTVVVISIR